MKRAGGGFDPAYNAQTAVDETAHIIVAAELTNVGSDANELLGMLQAIKSNLGQSAKQVLADAGYRNEAVFEQLARTDMDLVVALGREGKQHVRIDAATLPYTTAMSAKMQSEQTRSAYRKRKWIAEPPNGWIKNVLGFRQFSLRGLHRVQAEWKLVCMALNLRRMATLSTA
jgi:IS5 family transposase